MKGILELTYVTEEARHRFRERVRELDKKLSWAQLPRMNMAMHPSKVHFSDDLSETRLYNDRFIEVRVSQGNLSSALYIFGLMHNMGFFAFVVACIAERAFVWPLLLIYLVFCVGFCLNAIRLAVKYVGYDFVRFNRRMQLVHFWGVSGKQPRMMHLPWHEAVPFASSSRGNCAQLSFLSSSRTRSRNSCRASSVM